MDRLMLREVPRIPAETTLDAATERMREAESRVAAVYQGAHFAGLVSADDARPAFPRQLQQCGAGDVSLDRPADPRDCCRAPANQPARVPFDRVRGAI